MPHVPESLVEAVMLAAQSPVAIWMWKPLIVLAQLLAGWMVADFGSGVIHWAQDRYGSPRWRWVGPIVRDTIRHHRKPRGFLGKPVLARSGRMFGLALVMGTVLVLADMPAAFTLALMAGIALSNEIHAAAHARASALPFWVRGLQARGLIQSPQHHAAHHRALKNVHFCTLTDWTNPALERVRFWRRLEALMRLGGGIRTRRDPVVRRQQRRRWRTA